MKRALESFVPLTFKRCGVRRLAITTAPQLNPTLLEALGRAFYWQHLLDQGKVSSGADIARRENLDQSVVNVLLRLTLLAPDLIEQLMAGRQPRALTLIKLQRNPIPTDWQAQRALFTRFE